MQHSFARCVPLLVLDRQGLASLLIAMLFNRISDAFILPSFCPLVLGPSIVGKTGKTGKTHVRSRRPEFCVEEEYHIAVLFPFSGAIIEAF